jgi:xylulose-5-phosphate/fructose-6-phosphate phosphoketolase
MSLRDIDDEEILDCSIACACAYVGCDRWHRDTNASPCFHNLLISFTSSPPELELTPPTMATTGLASLAASKFDAVTPPKSSSLSHEIIGKLLVNLDDEIKDLQSNKGKENGIDLEGLQFFQRTADYM